MRTAPGSRHNPDTARAAMAQWLPAAGIGYRWEPRLGGWRHPPAAGGSGGGGDGVGVDAGLRNRSFRGYAAHMRTAEFRAAIDELLAQPLDGRRTAIMCGETVWWRCHRKLIADYLTLVRGVSVGHLMHDGRVHEHRPTAEARVAGDVLIYDGPG